MGDEEAAAAHDMAMSFVKEENKAEVEMMMPYMTHMTHKYCILKPMIIENLYEMREKMAPMMEMMGVRMESPSSSSSPSGSYDDHEWSPMGARSPMAEGNRPGKGN